MIDDENHGCAEGEVQRENAYLAALHETSLGLLSRPDLDSLLRDIVERACALLGTPLGYLTLVEQDTAQLAAIVGVGIDDPDALPPYKQGEGVAGTIWQTGEPLVVNDYHHWPGRLCDGEREQVRAVVGVPLVIGGRVVGVLTCVHIEPDKCFGPDAVALLTQFGQLAAIALDHARVHDALQRELAARTAAEGQLRAQYQGNPVAIFTWRRSDDDWIFTDYNKAADAMTGGTISSHLGRTARAIYTETPRFGEDLARCEREGRIVCAEVSWRFAATGARHDLAISYVPVPPDLVMMHVEEITARKRDEQRRAAFATLGQQLSAATTAMDVANVIAGVADTLLGWDAFSLLLYQPAHDTLHAVLNVDLIDDRRVAVPSGAPTRSPSPMARKTITEGGQLLLRDASPAPAPGLIPFGDTGRLSASLMFVPIRRGDEAIGILSIQSYRPAAYTPDDLATLQELADHCSGALERARAEAQLVHNALHDALTGLANRTLLADRLERAAARAKDDPAYRYALLYLDLDRFKVVNDSLGHETGDRLLAEVARRLVGCARETDTIARLGGDEFALLVEDLPTDDAAVAAARRVRTALSEPFIVTDRPLVVSVSIGIALNAPAHRKLDDILRDADTAMYRAKADGGEQYVVFDIAMHAQVVARLRLESDLRRAIEQEEFVLYYQPIMALRSGVIVGFEALVRWSRPGRGTVSAEHFIPLAEETGLIIPLDRWVLREACAQMRRWTRQYSSARDLAVSVNVSARDLSQPDFVARVLAVAGESGLARQHLMLEVTESVLVEHADRAATALGALHAAGIRVQLDDFGVGYSSLRYLHRFPITRLKIDRSFVCGEEGVASTGVANAEIVRTIVTLAHNLDISATAEGVETAEQREQLCALGCDYGQGYLFSAPVTAAHAGRLLARGIGRAATDRR